MKKLNLLLVALFATNSMAHLPQLPLLPETEDAAPIAVAITAIGIFIVLYCAGAEYAINYRNHGHRGWRRKYYPKSS